MALRVVPHPDAALSDGVAKHTIVQNKFMPHLHSISTQEHMGSQHAHPTDMKAQSSHRLHEILDSHSLSLRASFTPDNYTKQSVCTEISQDAIQALLRDGVVAVDAPMNRGQFRLHSTQAGQITGMEFIPSS